MKASSFQARAARGAIAAAALLALERESGGPAVEIDLQLLV